MASLDISKLDNIVCLLSEESTNQSTLEDIIKAAQKCFTRSELFKVCSIVSVLLQHVDLLPDPCQRLAALTMLHQLPRLDAAQSSPFTVQLHQLLGSFNDNSLKSQNKQKPQTLPDKPPETSLLTQTEKKFIVLLLSDINIQELLKQRPSQIISSLESSSSGGASPLSPDPCPAFRAAESLPAVARAGVSLLLPHPQPCGDSQLPDDAATASNTLRAVVQKGGIDLVQPFTPSFLRPAPPVYLTLNELVWLRNSQLETEEEVAYDASLCVTNEGDAEARRLMTRAFKETLSIPQLQQLLAHLEREPRLGYKTGLTPQKLPVLVEHNPLIAIEFLLRVMQTSQITDYLNVLVNMEMSLHSMEVVNRLTTTVELPPEFVHLYITNCIATCESIKDRYMQNRLVRLVCVFLQSLIRNKIINVQQLFVEVQAFCIEFSRIREAAALFKLLKQLDAGDGGSTATAGGGPGPAVPSASSTSSSTTTITTTTTVATAAATTTSVVTVSSSGGPTEAKKLPL